MKTLDQLFFAQVLAESPEDVSPHNISATYVHDVINNMSQVEFLHRLSDALTELKEQYMCELIRD